MRKLFLLLMTIIGVSLGATAQERTISGIVISGDDNEPIVGATVMVVGTTIAQRLTLTGGLQSNTPPQC